MKAIETAYKGYRFRSRLEARWAVFFDTMGFEYQYEPEGFDLDGLLYLPDFYLPRVKMWAEVKPESFSEEETKKAQLLAKHTGKPVLMLIGPPDMKNYWAWEYLNYYIYDDKIDSLVKTIDGNGNDGRFFTSDYLLCHYHSYYTDENRFYSSTGLAEDELFDPNDYMIEDMIFGVTAARQARFEHGEKGKTWELTS